MRMKHNEEKEGKMFYVVDCITGVRDETCGIKNLDDARKERDELNAKRKAEGGSDEFWIVIDEDGKECK